MCSVSARDSTSARGFLAAGTSGIQEQVVRGDVLEIWTVERWEW